MTGAGFFFVHRALWLSGSASLSREGEARRLEAWIWLLAQANWGESGDLKPGQLTTTRGKISAYTGWTDGKVRSWLKSLCKEGAISLKRNGNHSILTVENWAEYQSGYRLDLGPSQDRARTEPGPSQDREGSSSGEGFRADGTKLGPSQDQARTELGPATREESRTKNQTSGDKSPEGEVFDESGELWPKPKPGRMSYPQNFARIWEVWRRAQKAAPGVVKAAGKGNAYDLCRGHISRGSTSEEMRTAAIKYLTPYTSKRETVGCFQPSRFYRASGPEFLEYLDAPESGSGTASTRERWRRPSDAWRECAALSSHFGLDLPKMPERNHGPQWEDVEAFHPLILKWAPDLHGFKTPPEDLKEQIAGGENGSC